MRVFVESLLTASPCRLCKPMTVVLSFGWNSAGMGKDFETLELLLVAHGGAHNDTICLAQRMTQAELL